MDTSAFESKHPPVLCTIIAKNYLAFARTLCKSFLANHPDGACYVLILDQWYGFVDPNAECFKIVSLEDLDIPNSPSFCFKYKLIELATAVKPYLLDHLLTACSLANLIYLDPDILITRPLVDLYLELTAHDIVLTPHLDADFPDDGLMPDDARIMMTGIFNLGFIGISSNENALKFLAWWKRKVYNKCLDAARDGYFLDQKFLDLALVVFPNIYLEKRVGFNAAHWNLHSRRLEYKNGEWLCNGDPLYFFHFSAFRPEYPERISKHLTRYTLADRPDLRPLFLAYAKKLAENGYAETRQLPYTFATFRSGRRIPDGFRRYYLNMPDKWAEYGNPFESEQLERLLERFHRFRWPLQLLYDSFQTNRIKEKVEIFR